MFWEQKQITAIAGYSHDCNNSHLVMTPDGTKAVIFVYDYYGGISDTLLTYTHNGVQWTYVNSYQPTVENRRLCSIALSSDGLVLYLGVGGSSSVGIQVFDWTGGVWVKRTTNICVPTDVCSYYGYGMSLSPDNNTMVICGSTAYSNRYYSYVYTFDWNGSSWTYRYRFQGNDIRYINNGYGNRTSFFSDNQKLVVSNVNEYTLNKGTLRTYINNSGVWTEITTGLIIKNTGYFYQGGLSLTDDDKLYLMEYNYYLLPLFAYQWSNETSSFSLVSVNAEANDSYALLTGSCCRNGRRILLFSYRTATGLTYVAGYTLFDTTIRGIIKYNSKVSDRIHDIEVFKYGQSTVLVTSKSNRDGTFSIELPIKDNVTIKIYDNPHVLGEILEA